MSDQLDLKQKQFFYKKASLPNINIAWAFIEHADNTNNPCSVSLLDNVFGVYKTIQLNTSSEAVNHLVENDYKDYDMREKVATTDDITPPKQPFSSSPISIEGYWCKVIGMGERHWAVITSANNRCEVIFFMDDSCIFDKMTFFSSDQAKQALDNNGFSLYAEDEMLQKFVVAPQHPFGHRDHPSGKIYSSGKYWLQ